MTIQNNLTPSLTECYQVQPPTAHSFQLYVNQNCSAFYDRFNQECFACPIEEFKANLEKISGNVEQEWTRLSRMQKNCECMTTVEIMTYDFLSEFYEA